MVHELRHERVRDNSALQSLSDAGDVLASLEDLVLEDGVQAVPEEVHVSEEARGFLEVEGGSVQERDVTGRGGEGT